MTVEEIIGLLEKLANDLREDVTITREAGKPFTSLGIQAALTKIDKIVWDIKHESSTT